VDRGREMIGIFIVGLRGGHTVRGQREEQGGWERKKKGHELVVNGDSRGDRSNSRYDRREKGKRGGDNWTEILAWQKPVSVLD